MGDHDHGRETRRKKHNKSSRNKDKDESNIFPSRKTPSILTKSNAERKSQPKIIEPAPVQPSQPTIILKSRDASSPNPRSKPKEAESPLQSTNHKVAPENGPSTLLAPYPVMNCVLKLIDGGMEFQASLKLQDHLTDQMDFCVVGVIGLQGSGKSTILSLLVSDECNENDGVFKVQSRDDIIKCVHCTSGVDIYVTSNRLILLDTQPILSPSILNANINSKKKLSYDCLGVNNKTSSGSSNKNTDGSTSFENGVEIQSLQLSAFIFSVCHVVLFVQDWFVDPNFVRFLQTTEMLKPSFICNRAAAEYPEYFPEGIFVQNKGQPSDYMKNNIEEMQEFYSNAFLKSKLFIHTGKSLSLDGTIRQGSQDQQDADTSFCNIYLIPNLDCQYEETFGNHPDLKKIVSNLRRQIMGGNRRNLSVSPMSEKNWLNYAGKVWENIKKNSYFQEYNRLLP